MDEFSPMPDSQPTWFEEEGNWAESHCFLVRQTLFKGHTAFQEIEILDTAEYGKMLVIDGATQSAAFDEYVYHEALVHPAMTLHPAPRRVLIVGGGEGATLREVLRHPAVETAVMVDIDGLLVEHCKTLLPEWSAGAFADPRSRVIIDDGVRFLAESQDRFDVAIIDVADDDCDNASAPIYAPAFYASVRDHLDPGGLVTIQGMELAPGETAHHRSIRQNVAAAFPQIRSYSTFVPSFWCDWGYLLAGAALPPDWDSPDRIDADLARRGLAATLRFYDGQCHRRMFSLSKDIRQALTLP